VVPIREEKGMLESSARQMLPSTNLTVKEIRSLCGGEQAFSWDLGSRLSQHERVSDELSLSLLV
jgi:hypothetical protein